MLAKVSILSRNLQPSEQIHMKYSQWIGIIAAIGLMASCFMPWAYYPDLRQHFTGFYSFENVYGRPAVAFYPFAIICIVFYLIPRVWAKRWNLFFTVLCFAYAIKTFILFSSCYRGICPTKETGIWLMFGFTVLMLLAALLPPGKVKNSED